MVKNLESGGKDNAPQTKREKGSFLSPVSEQSGRTLKSKALCDSALSALMDQHLHWLATTYLLDIMCARKMETARLCGLHCSHPAKSPRFKWSKSFEWKDAMKCHPRGVKSDKQLWGSTHPLLLCSMDICSSLASVAVFSFLNNKHREKYLNADNI